MLAHLGKNPHVDPKRRVSRCEGLQEIHGVTVKILEALFSDVLLK